MPDPQDISIQPYTRADLPKLADFIRGYREAYPDAKVNSAEFYTLHPALTGGENVLCAIGPGGQIAGFAPLIPVETTDENGVTGPHDVWAILVADPRLAQAGRARELLLAGLIAKVAALKAQAGLAQVRLNMEMMDSQAADLAFLLEKGFAPFERVLGMRRATGAPIPTAPPPEGIALRPTRLASPEERAKYLQVYNACFPESPKDLDDWGFLFESPLWNQGSAVVAESYPGEHAGSILLYVEEDSGAGISDDVMAQPAWRGRGLAKSLIGEGLRYFQQLGVQEARLEVKQSNTPAVAAYTAMGYQVHTQMSLLRRVV